MLAIYVAVRTAGMPAGYTGALLAFRASAVTMSLTRMKIAIPRIGSTIRRLAIPAILIAAGCTTRPAFFHNPDPALRKEQWQFAADARTRHYEADAPRAGNANGGVEIDYAVRRLNLVNSSSHDWVNVEIWVDKKYVIMVPRVLAEAQRAELLDFNTIFDHDGRPLPPDINTTQITTVEMYRDGKMYDLPIHLAD